MEFRLTALTSLLTFLVFLHIRCSLLLQCTNFSSYTKDVTKCHPIFTSGAWEPWLGGNGHSISLPFLHRFLELCNWRLYLKKHFHVNGGCWWKGSPAMSSRWNSCQFHKARSGGAGRVPDHRLWRRASLLTSWLIRHFYWLSIFCVQTYGMIWSGQPLATRDSVLIT